MNRIEQVLIENHISKPEFQKKLGVLSQHWNNWKIRGIPSLRIFQIAKELDININYLAFGIDDKYAINAIAVPPNVKEDFKMEKPQLTIWTIYFSPKDFPNEYVARMFELDQPTKSILIAPDIEALRIKIKKISDHELVRINRSDNDHRSVIESWI